MAEGGKHSIISLEQCWKLRGENISVWQISYKDHPNWHCNYFARYFTDNEILGIFL